MALLIQVALIVRLIDTGSKRSELLNLFGEKSAKFRLKLRSQMSSGLGPSMSSNEMGFAFVRRLSASYEWHTRSRLKGSTARVCVRYTVRSAQKLLETTYASG
ncbi:uncharacterized protein CCR75_000100 [Bremia lactucae]|uniref:Uncharacterized protein n=1 Tax=Bremia lactucae TaxID=4779 RepID=A0A976NXT9_BRELC|nr:hypothetical protein CCR75_000100 [Bremia lactucae]